MIHVTKPARAPAALDEGAALVSALEAMRAADPANGGKERAFTFDNAIYGAVKGALRAAQSDKCCYCEGFFAGQYHGDVEHFRPKARVQQAPRSPFLYPGYYWLAYTWSNLYYSCKICNSSGKRSLFPLDDPEQRARRQADSLDQESPQILDPGGAEDPRDHIKFKGSTPYGATDLGKSTIRYLRLDRDDLELARLNHLQILNSLKKITELVPDGLRERAIEELSRLAEPDKAYSAMVQDYLAA